MSYHLVLPQTTTVPDAAASIVRVEDCAGGDAAGSSAIAQLASYYATLAPQPAHIVGSTATPALHWLLAARTFPQAQLHCAVQTGDDEVSWCTLPVPHAAPAGDKAAAASAPSPGDQAAQPGHAERPTLPDTAAPPATDCATPPGKAGQPGDIRALTANQLIANAFKYAAWGTDDSDHARMLELLQEEALRRAAQHPGQDAGLPSVVQKARRSGELAHTLGGQLQEKLDRGGDTPEIGAWMDKVCTGTHARVRRHLDITLKKWRDRQQKLRERARLQQQGREQARAAGKRFSATSLEPVQLAGGHHPNSLRHLPPASQWEILIDESGSQFGEATDALAPFDHSVGRVVALAVPQHVRLPALPSGFHAADVAASSVDRALQTVLGAPVGVFGFTVRDSAATAMRWIGHIHQLARWVLLQLPLRTDIPSRVWVKIEERSDWGRTQSLHALGSLLEDELRQLDRARFGQLHLSLELIAKTDHHANGYVDAIAFTWGSPSQGSKERLKNSRLPGHCLLRPTDEAMERLYLALNNRRALPTAYWYELCAATADEPEGGLLRAFSDQLGEQARAAPAFWHACLDQVRQQLRTKQFQLDALAAALGWLERWCPQGAVLPATQQLRLETARLATENHRGQINPQRFERCLELSARLIDEAPDEACEAILRLAVTTANNFQFAVMQDTIDEWLAKPVAIPGLLNHAKLHSTLGQIHAFSGRPGQAVGSFDAALAAFGRLSDPQQIAREVAQTTIYRLIAVLDDPSVAPAQGVAGVVEHLCAATRKPDPQAVSRSLAVSGQQLRFDHHLWLRTLVAHPAQLAAARSDYLAQQPHWQSGEDHPWPLIDAYRAWLLRDAGQAHDAARYFGNAIAGCHTSEQGPTLLWMAEVLRTLACALGVPCDTGDDPQRLTRLQDQLPYAPFYALAAFRRQAAGSPSHEDIVTALGACLPFNFH